MGSDQTSKQTTASTSTTAKPAYVTTASTDLANAADTALATPVTPYTGQLAAPTNANQNAAITGMANEVATAPSTNPQVTADINSYANAPAQNVQVGTVVDPNGPLGSIASYMDPEIANSLIPAISAIQLQANQQQNQNNAQATEEGAFGDARQGVQSGLIDFNEDTSIGNTADTAYENAFNQAMSEREQDLSASMLKPIPMLGTISRPRTRH